MSRDVYIGEGVSTVLKFYIYRFYFDQVVIDEGVGLVSNVGEGERVVD